MPAYRYSVCKADTRIFPELKQMNKSNHELMLFLKENTFAIISADTDDRFSRYDDAETFARDAYTKNNSGDVIAIYDWYNKVWTDGWFL